MTFNMMTVGITEKHATLGAIISRCTKGCYADCHLCRVLFMLSVTMLSVIMMSVIMMSVIMLCHYVACHNDECHYADYHYVGCHCRSR
jgi:hypothetical protein